MSNQKNEFSSTKFIRVSIFLIKKEADLVETLMIKFISSPYSSQYIRQNR